MTSKLGKRSAHPTRLPGRFIAIQPPTIEKASDGKRLEIASPGGVAFS
jgi:hypothetical protein